MKRKLNLYWKLLIEIFMNSFCMFFFIYEDVLKEKRKRIKYSSRRGCNSEEDESEGRREENNLEVSKL